MYLPSILPVNLSHARRTMRFFHLNRGLNRSRRTIFGLDFEICKKIRDQGKREARKQLNFNINKSEAIEKLGFLIIRII